ncbi:uncharacterized protein BP5553_04489 [Venustampulla echinocandica]|uniref:Calcineurin-like phosphoesterase domain-containing protein n=1 Tax=Venustampulla echinocandica TaxID=2656787 RepID=A0A370TNF1_9HELO|nr:uncharacterized protein BP5553_04489 [Venustampulla echinocandica]RDL37056.1 hypothetical protein BP5553_04489 [Venustampulla echinocandica]
MKNHITTEQLPISSPLDLAKPQSAKPSQSATVRLEELSTLSTQYSRIIIIGGNHDRALDPSCDERDATLYNDLDARIAYREAFDNTLGVTYLCNNSTIVRAGDRMLRIWGSPGSIATSRQTAFGYTAGSMAEELWEQTPKDIDILITHGPPLGYLDGDNNLGCCTLLAALWQIRPLLHVFGHVHQSRGRCVLKYNSNQAEYDTMMLSRKKREEIDAEEVKYTPPHLRAAGESSGAISMPEQMTKSGGEGLY